MISSAIPLLLVGNFLAGGNDVFLEYNTDVESQLVLMRLEGVAIAVVEKLVVCQSVRIAES